MNGEPDEIEFERYLAGDSLVSRRYRELDAREVPPEIDRAILARAAEAVHPVKQRHLKRWGVPIALAASLVLVVSIAIEGIRHEATTASAPAPSSSMHEWPVPAVVDRESVAPVDEAKVAQDGPLALDPPAPRAAEPLTAEPPSTLRAAPARPPVRRAEPQPQAAEQAMAYEPALPAAPPPAAVAAPAPQLSERAASARAREEVGEPQLVSAVERDPAEWLAEIRKLREAGRNEDADREWHDFREMFPRYEVAPDDPARPSS